MFNQPWLIYALLSAAAAALVGIFGKIGMRDVDSNLATAVRSIVMTLFLLGVCQVMGVWSKVATLGGDCLFDSLKRSAVAGVEASLGHDPAASGV